VERETVGAAGEESWRDDQVSEGEKVHEGEKPAEVEKAPEGTIFFKFYIFIFILFLYLIF